MHRKRSKFRLSPTYIFKLLKKIFPDEKLKLDPRNLYRIVQLMYYSPQDILVRRKRIGMLWVIHTNSGVARISIRGEGKKGKTFSNKQQKIQENMRWEFLAVLPGSIFLFSPPPSTTLKNIIMTHCNIANQVWSHLFIFIPTQYTTSDFQQTPTHLSRSDFKYGLQYWASSPRKKYIGLKIITIFSCNWQVHWLICWASALLFCFWW